MELAAVCHAAGYTQALAQGPRGHVNKAKPRGGVTLEVGVNLAEVHQVLPGEEASLRPGGIQDWGSVTLGQDEPDNINVINQSVMLAESNAFKNIPVGQLKISNLVIG